MRKHDLKVILPNDVSADDCLILFTPEPSDICPEFSTAGEISVVSRDVESVGAFGEWGKYLYLIDPARAALYFCEGYEKRRTSHAEALAAWKIAPMTFRHAVLVSIANSLVAGYNMSPAAVGEAFQNILEYREPSYPRIITKTSIALEPMLMQRWNENMALEEAKELEKTDLDASDDEPLTSDDDVYGGETLEAEGFAAHAHKLERAILSLNPDDDEHWTDDGWPKVSMLAAITNRPGLSRKDVFDALPHWGRGDAAARDDQKIRDVVAGLDPLHHNLWTADGFPEACVVAARTGIPSVTREKINSVYEGGWNREKAFKIIK